MGRSGSSSDCLVVWEKAVLAESHAVVGGARCESCLPARMSGAQQVTQRRLPRLPVNGLIIAVGEGFPL